MFNKGDRVGAILYTKDKVVYFLGYGEYLGNHVPDKNAGGLASVCHKANRPNPKIKLDNGDIVWGGECWWDLEESINKQIEEYKQVGYKVEIIDINKRREEESS